MAKKPGKLPKMPRLGYYSSKPDHKNSALWTKSSTITIGDPYTKKTKPLSRMRGRQFQSGKREHATFDEFKALSILPTKNYKSDSYTKKRREKYTSVEGPDMTGFASRNARNIAMDTMSTRRWAEKLKKESVYKKAALTKRWTQKLMAETGLHERETLTKKPSLPELKRISTSAPSGQEIFLFDRTRPGNDDRLKWKPKKGKDRRLGSTKPSSSSYGAHLTDAPTYEPSKWLRVNKRKEFYNNGSIDKMLGGGNDYYLNM